MRVNSGVGKGKVAMAVARYEPPISITMLFDCNRQEK